MRNFLRIAGAILALVLVSATAVRADDWVAVKLRGEVVQLVGDKWLPLKRNDVVSDDRAIRTGKSGFVVFERDTETVEMAASTQIRIHDRAGERFTVVEQHFGKISVEAEVQNVQHFAVETPFLAAVVKGTKFTVNTTKTMSSVKVTRGKVAVEARADGSKVLITAGQSASSAPEGSSPSGTTVLGVSGLGALPEVIEGTGEIVGGLVDDLLGDDLLGLGNLGHGNNGHHGNGNSGQGGGAGGSGAGGSGAGGSGGSGGGSGSGGGGGSSGGGVGGLVGGLLGRLL